jgi:hypothetical protein
MKTTVVLLGGARRVGKDTAANILVSQINKMPWAHAQRFGFADELRRECHEAFNTLDASQSLPPIDFWTNEPEIKEKVVRPILIAWGMARRHQDENYWVRRVFDSINFFRENGNVNDLEEKEHATHVFAVISDWRFPNEFLQSERVFPTLVPIHISRPGQDMTPDEIKHDPTIRSQAKFCIENSGTQDDFQRSLHSLLYGQILHHA